MSTAPSPAAQPEDQTTTAYPDVGSAPTQGDLSTGTSPARGQVAGGAIPVREVPPPYTWRQRLFYDGVFVLGRVTMWVLAMVGLAFAGAIAHLNTGWDVVTVNVYVGSAALITTVLMAISLLHGLIDGPDPEDEEVDG